MLRLHQTALVRRVVVLRRLVARRRRAQLVVIRTHERRLPPLILLEVGLDGAVLVRHRRRCRLLLAPPRVGALPIRACKALIQVEFLPLVQQLLGRRQTLLLEGDAAELRLQPRALRRLRCVHGRDARRQRCRLARVFRSKRCRRRRDVLCRLYPPLRGLRTRQAPYTVDVGHLLRQERVLVALGPVDESAAVLLLLRGAPLGNN
mmetsp:Transcript_6494/g.16161  ORF Transcript_6494/g.16161 Transcript_6494/m.16161 type:complete len:205 (+) Transcript_6494:505-1119(+)